MEFNFNINNILGDEITTVDSALRPFRNNHAGHTYKTQLCAVIDDMGVASAKAQGLGGAITSASRLSHSDHHIYIMKDNVSTRAGGAVVGILKVGHKKLFIYENHGKQHEMDPLCVLDFYVHESKQRTGCGKRLFEHMLKEEGVRPMHLAIDRPSPKFINFLGRHYKMKAPIPQVNNFVVFEGFFRDRPAENTNNRRRGKPPLIPMRQNSVDRWQQQSPVGSSRIDRTSVGHLHREAAGGSGHELVWDRRHGSPTLLHHDSGEQDPGKEMLRNVQPRDANSAPADRAGSAGGNNPESPSHRGMGAQNSMYSRHQEAAPAHTSADPTRSSTPPMLRRDGPSQDYLAMRDNVQPTQTYQNRRGHLVVAERTSPVKENPSSQGDTNRGGLPIKPDSSWNVFGVPSSPKHSAVNRGHQHTRLW